MRCFRRLHTMCKPLANANWIKAIHTPSVQRSGDELVGGGERCLRFGSTRELGGSGDGERSG